MKTTKQVKQNVYDTLHTGKLHGLLQNITEDQFYDGRSISIRGRKLINFGSCSYLGLELDPRLKKSAINAIKRYGIQYSSSRGYVSCSLYHEWIYLLESIFEHPIILSTNTSIGHQSVIPIIVENNDLIILDQQVHASVQDAVKKTIVDGVTVKYVQHNNMEKLELLIKDSVNKYSNIWYMADGLYSMYGDFAPMDQLETLLNKYDKFHLYVDDAHGMSMFGKHGVGYCLSKVNLHPKMVLATSMAKAYGCGGGIFVFPTKELRDFVYTTGGSFIFSGPHQIPVIGAGIASAKIHLSNEIYELQEKNMKNLLFCNELMEYYKLPVVSNPNSPINYVGIGLRRTGYNVVRRILNDGFYVNLGIFPAVPEASTGIRFTITNHIEFKDIERLVKSIAKHIPLAFKEEDRDIRDIHRGFSKVKKFDDILSLPQTQRNATIRVVHKKSIREVPEGLWNKYLAQSGANNVDHLKALEDIFSNNKDSEHNWNFHYIIIYENDVPVLLSFYTISDIKEDIFSNEFVSKKIEEIRKNDKNKYYLCSKAMSMGCIISSSQSLYIDRTNSAWKKFMMLMLDKVWEIQKEEDANYLFLRDFTPDDIELKNFFMDQGFLFTNCPDSYTLQLPNNENLIDKLNHSKRRWIKQRAICNEELFECNVLTAENESQTLHDLYLNVANKSFEINSFQLPVKFFEEAPNKKNWEALVLRTKSDNKIVASAINYVTENSYNFLIVGLDYSRTEQFIYHQLLWQIIKRAESLNIKTIELGYTAAYCKKQFGADTNKCIAYVQVKDDFNSKVIASIENERYQLV